VIHTACHYGRNGSALSEVVESNLIFGLKVLEAAINYQVTTFINTDSFLPRDLNAYSLSKKQLIDWLKQQSSKIQVINLQLEHMYGPKDDSTKFIAWLVTQLKQNVSEINLTSGIQKRDFIYIDDVVSAFLCVLQSSTGLPSFSEFEVGTGESIEVKTFVQNLKQVFEQRNGPTSTKLNFGAVPYRQGEIMEFKVDNQALRQLGWEPKVNLSQGLEQSLKEYA
ncbi:MAG: NAD-dependent epimerase/dehydratase family protein, partial [Moraxella osloensis]|nr:NAD-dependent epimerase/dehydratase family protein [Moraxella osloensis]